MAANLGAPPRRLSKATAITGQVPPGSTSKPRPQLTWLATASAPFVIFLQLHIYLAIYILGICRAPRVCELLYLNLATAYTFSFSSAANSAQPRKSTAACIPAPATSLATPLHPTTHATSLAAAMADASCSGGTPFKQLMDHQSRDVSHHQDRLVNGNQPRGVRI